MFIPPFLRPGELAWVAVRQPRIKPHTATGDTKLRPAMLVGEVDPGRWMVVGLTSLATYADNKPRTQVPPHLWAEVAEGRPSIKPVAYLWGGGAPVVNVDDIAEHITDAGPELRAAILSSVQNVPAPLRAAALRLRPDELADAIAAGTIPAPEPPSSEWPLVPGAPKHADDHAPADTADLDDPPGEQVEQVEQVEEATAPGEHLELVAEPSTLQAIDTAMNELAPDHEPTTHLTDEVLDALAALARVTGDDDPFFRSTFSAETVRSLITEAQAGRQRNAQDREALASARSALVAARSEIQRLAEGESNWVGPETSAIAAIDESLRVA
jgi:hypothetical protein